MKRNVGKKARTLFGDGEIVGLDPPGSREPQRYRVELLRNLTMGEIFKNTILCFLPEEVEIYE